MPLSSRSASLPSSPHKPALRTGSLQRLLHPPPDADDDDEPALGAATPRARVPVLLQVTNITPALSGSDIFSGHHGFYLRLSDSVHSCYVSLHADHDDLILTNGLHIGQLVEVEHLVPSVPAPVLCKFRVLPGRYPCIQQDSADDTACSGSEIKEVVSERPRWRTPPLPERKARQGSPAGRYHRSRSIQGLSDAGVATATATAKRRSTELSRKLSKISVTSVDENSSDDESEVSSSFSSLSSARRNWDFTGSGKDKRPVSSRRRSASVSPIRSGQNSYVQQNDAANDPLEAVRRKSEKAFKVLSKKNSCSSNKISRESPCAVTPQSASSGIKWCDSNVMWSSLSSSLMRHGKEAVKHRDMALQAVLDGLLEANTTEKLIKCLSTYSELQIDKDDDPKELIDRFLQFYQELDHAIFIAQSQTRFRQIRTSSSNSATSGGAKAATNVALDRKQSAILWIKAALEADLSPFSSQPKATSESTKTSFGESKPATPLFPCCSKPKCNCSNRYLRKLTSDASSDGGNLNANMELANALRSECNRWFLKYIDKFLDEIDSETDCAVCDSQVAGLLQQLKRVDDWLNRVVRNERAFSVDRSNKDSIFSEEEESDACKRVRKKIYGVLLRHVQYAALALESITSVTDEKK